MDRKRAIQWLIPLLYGVSIGLMVAGTIENGFGRDGVLRFVFPVGIAAILAATFLKSQTGYNWPWEGPAEWTEGEATSTKTLLRYLALWMVIVFLLLVTFTLLQRP
jgi:hypothetical protein